MFEVHVQNKLPSNVYFSTSSLFYPFVINYYKENHNNCTFSFNEFRFVTFIAFHSMQKIFIFKWIGVFVNMLFFASKHKITTKYKIKRGTMQIYKLVYYGQKTQKYLVLRLEGEEELFLG